MLMWPAVPWATTSLVWWCLQANLSACKSGKSQARRSSWVSTCSQSHLKLHSWLFTINSFIHSPNENWLYMEISNCLSFNHASSFGYILADAPARQFSRTLFPCLPWNSLTASSYFPHGSTTATAYKVCVKRTLPGNAYLLFFTWVCLPLGFAFSCFLPVLNSFTCYSVVVNDRHPFFF